MTIDWTQVETLEQRQATALAEARVAAEVELCASIDAIGDAIAGRYPRTERDTWPQQEVAARAWQAEAVTPEQMVLLTALASARGYPIADLVPSIIAKADAWRLVGGSLAGIRGAAFEALAAATSPAQVAGILAGAQAGIAQVLAAAQA